VYIVNPVAPKLTAQLKFHKGNSPIRLVLNNIGAAGYNLVKFLSQTLEANVKLLTLSLCD
jgi:hypothetical protein